MTSGWNFVRKVLIIGSGGAGKSTLAVRLGEVLRLPVIHLDRLFWNPGWVATPEDEWRTRVEEISKGGNWIMDGNFGGTMDLRLAACDTVIYLDFPRTLCTWRVIRRWLTYRDGTRPDMAEGCREKFDREFVSWVWNFPKISRPKIEEKISRIGNGTTIVRLRSPEAVGAFVRDLSERRNSSLPMG